MSFYVFPGSLRYKFCCCAYFVYVIESQFQKCVKYNVRAGQIVVLRIERRGRKSDSVFEIIDYGKGIIDSNFAWWGQ